jgi:O-antigen ligase
MWLQGWKRFGPTNPIRIGMYYSLTTLLCFIKFLDANESRKKTTLLLLMVLNFLPVLASQSRGPLLALLVTFVFIILFYRVNKKIILGLFLGLFYSFGMVICNSTLYTAIASRISEDSCRKEIWSQSISQTIENNLWLGCGRGDRINIPVELPQRNNKILTFSFSHNQFIDAFYVLGIVGFLLFIIFNINVLLQYTKEPSLFPFFVWFILGSLCAFTVGNSNIDLDVNWLYFWMPAGLIGALDSQKKIV